METFGADISIETFEADISAFLSRVKDDTSLPPRFELNRCTLMTTDSLYDEETELCGEYLIIDDEWDTDTEGIDAISQQHETYDVTGETPRDVITIEDTPVITIEDTPNLMDITLPSVINIEDTPNSIGYDDISDDDYSTSYLTPYDYDDRSDCEFEGITDSFEHGPMEATVNMDNTEFLKVANKLGFYVIDGILREYKQCEL